jgi:molybdopterin synthase sulfur carrier subunit
LNEIRIPKSEIRNKSEYRNPNDQLATVGHIGLRVPDFGFPSDFGFRISDFPMIRVVLPYHLRNLARIDGEVELEVNGPTTLRSVLDALEARFPVLRGTIRDHVTLKRRPFVRFFACKEDLSLEPPETKLPEEVVAGTEPFLIIGAMAGG